MHEPPKARVFVEGRYRKLSRDLPQTVFFCPECKGHPRRRRGCARCEGFGKLSRDSVQELVGWVAGRHFGTRKNKFHGAGREDVDVRMLGEGRPFVLELLGPKQFDVDLAAVEGEVNERNAGRLEVRGLHWTEKTRVRVVKETQHAKEYEALVVSRGPLALERLEPLFGERLEIVQHTPERVAHRRAHLDRTRWVEFVAVEPAGADEIEAACVPSAPVDQIGRAPAEAAVEPTAESTTGDDEGGWSHHWRVRLRTQHGTYVKEVLSGAGAVTRPNFPELAGAPCRCLALDVTAILDEEGRDLALPAAHPNFGAGLA